jgi:hypothetical protein
MAEFRHRGVWLMRLKILEKIGLGMQGVTNPDRPPRGHSWFHREVKIYLKY